MPDAPSPSDLSAALAKLDRALQQIEEMMRDRPGDPRLEMAIASLESARADLLGQKPN